MLHLHDEDFSLLRTVKQLSSSLNEECFIGSVLFLHCSMTSFLEKSGAERPHAVTALRLPEHLRNSPRRCRSCQGHPTGSAGHHSGGRFFMQL